MQKITCPNRPNTNRGSKTTWDNFVSIYGEYDARRRLRWLFRPHAFERDTPAEPHLFIQMLVTPPAYQQETAQHCRKKYSSLIRSVLRVARERRERLASLLAPGVSATRLP